MTAWRTALSTGTLMLLPLAGLAAPAEQMLCTPATYKLHEEQRQLDSTTTQRADRSLDCGTVVGRRRECEPFAIAMSDLKATDEGYVFQSVRGRGGIEVSLDVHIAKADGRFVHTETTENRVLTTTEVSTGRCVRQKP